MLHLRVLDKSSSYLTKQGPANKALHLTPENVAQMHEYHHLYRVERAVLGRGAQVSLAVRPLCESHRTPDVLVGAVVAGTCGSAILACIPTQL